MRCCGSVYKSCYKSCSIGYGNSEIVEAHRASCSTAAAGYKRRSDVQNAVTRRTTLCAAAVVPRPATWSDWTRGLCTSRMVRLAAVPA